MDNKKIRKRILYIFLNVFLPLFNGFLFYALFKPNTYIYNFVNEFFNLPQYKVSVFFVKCINNWGCDFLWAYALNSSLFAVFYQFKNPLLIAVLLTGFVGFVLECFQLVGILNGTFDFMDIISEILAIIISGLIIKKYEGDLQ